jgi:hypothetical protein
VDDDEREEEVAVGLQVAAAHEHAARELRHGQAGDDDLQDGGRFVGSGGRDFSC